MLLNKARLSAQVFFLLFIALWQKGKGEERRRAPKKRLCFECYVDRGGDCKEICLWAGAGDRIEDSRTHEGSVEEAWVWVCGCRCHCVNVL
jgi:hypothetical protein